MRASSAVIVGVGSAAVLVIGWQAGATRLADGPSVVPTEVPGPSQTATPLPTTPASTPTPTPTPVGPVVAVHDGQVIDTKYGTVQVRVVITDGVISDVSALKLTDSSDTSVSISARARRSCARRCWPPSPLPSATSVAPPIHPTYLSSVQSALDAAGFTG